jgi:hypothetical protein
MLSRLIVENFKSFGQRTQIPLAPITVLVGENSAGKSSDIRQAEHGREMHHDRFLLTDQIALQVSRGFDLLRADGRVKDVLVQPVRDMSAVLAAFNGLAKSRQV